MHASSEKSEKSRISGSSVSSALVDQVCEMGERFRFLM